MPILWNIFWDISNKNVSACTGDFSFRLCFFFTSATLVWITRDTSARAPISGEKKKKEIQKILGGWAKGGKKRQQSQSQGVPKHFAIVVVNGWTRSPHQGKGEWKELKWDEQLGRKTGKELELLWRCNLGVIAASWENGHHFPDHPLTPHTWTCFFFCFPELLQLPCCSCVALGHFLLWSPSSWPSPQHCWTLPDSGWAVCAFPWATEETVLSVFPLTKGQPHLAYPRAPPSSNVPLLLQMTELLTGLCVSFHFPFPSLGRFFQYWEVSSHSSAPCCCSEEGASLLVNCFLFLPDFFNRWPLDFSWCLQGRNTKQNRKNKKKKGILNYWEKGSSNENAGNKGLKQNIFTVSREGRIKIN